MHQTSPTLVPASIGQAVSTGREAGTLIGLAPIADARARILILGSFPGEASLAAAAYYGHPRNHFWRLVGGLFGESPAALDYAHRIEWLQAHGIAVWDVIAQCERKGSLDTAIRAEVANDIGGLLRRCSDISVIAFNGGKSASYIGRVAAIPEAARCRLVRLPSSSPANATHSLAVKQAAWDAALAPALR
ncbi:MAG: DNA-deoxyinosine glycosylase [Burkholderiaceae bacterium]